MNAEKQRSGAGLLLRFLVAGLRVDWRFSLVVILVITGLFSTPLALGSIKNRVYAAVKEQIEKENNAREIRLELADEAGRKLDDNLIRDLEAETEEFQNLDAVGNRKLVVSIEGPEGSDFLTLQTLEPGDPRATPLGIVPGIPADFGLADLIVSDTLGQRLYGEETWQELSQTGEYPLADNLRLSINELPISAAFRVVARRTLPGTGLYASPQAGEALRRYTSGFGAVEFELPADDALVQAALPQVVTNRCRILLEEADPSCTAEAQSTLERRLRDQHHDLEPSSEIDYPSIDGHQSFLLAPQELFEPGGQNEIRPRYGRCRDIVRPQLIDRCTRAKVVDELHLTLSVVQRDPAEIEDSTRQVELVSLDPEYLGLLDGWQDLRDRFGTLPPTSTELVFTLPLSENRGIGDRLTITVGDHSLPIRVGSFYRCNPEEPCPWIADPRTVFRLKNLVDGIVDVASLEPFVLIPSGATESFDQILAYAPDVQEVPKIAEHLQEQYPGLSVQYNAAALDKLERQDSRLSVLFTLTMTLSALFLFLALAALAQINLERRSRQMAQMLILGFRRQFVRRLVVAEYVLLTTLSAIASLGFTAVLFAIARSQLRSSPNTSSGRDFAVIVDSMSIDPKAFLVVFTGVLVCTSLIAMVSARGAAKADPLTLLD
ncbi:MAG: ABC transporter permease [Acidobacteriota bacterium]|nr:ABC transporter permease [Acidobacteriota bacterium]